MTRRPNFCPLYFPPNEVRLCMHLEIKDLPSGLPTRMKTHLQLFQRIQKNSAKLLRNCDAFLSGPFPRGVLLTERIHSSASYSFLASSKVDSTWLSLAQGNKNRKRKRKQPTYKEPRKKQIQQPTRHQHQSNNGSTQINNRPTKTTNIIKTATKHTNVNTNSTNTQ